MGGVEAKMDGGELNEEKERKETEGVAKGDWGAPEHEPSQCSDPSDVGGLPPVNGAPSGETDPVIIASTKLSKDISGEKPDFQLILQEIDSELSKFDSTKMGLNTIRPMIVVDQAEDQFNHKNPSSTGSLSEWDEPNELPGSPHELKNTTRGWKRLIQDRAPVETQPMQTEKKRLVREKEDISGGETSGKKIRLSIVEAASQPRRDQ